MAQTLRDSPAQRLQSMADVPHGGRTRHNWGHQAKTMEGVDVIVEDEAGRARHDQRKGQRDPA
jgi:hypothetical protein